MIDLREIDNEFSPNRPLVPKKVWRLKSNPPYRILLLWGWNKNNEPSFIIFYGKHKFNKITYDGDKIGGNLSDFVTYTGFYVLNGSNGHLPSFEAVKMVEYPRYYNSNDKDLYPRLYYKKGDISISLIILIY